MQAMLIRESYKVIRTLDTMQDYAFLEGVDIKDREKSTCFLNLYEGELLAAFLDVYDRMKSCSGLKELFVHQGTLVGVFRVERGTPIDQVFFRGAELDWRTRLEFAELLLHRALTLSDLPAEVACAAMLSENILVDLDEGRLSTLWHIPPMGEMNGRELVYLTIDQLHKILLKRYRSTLPELEFMQLLDDGACTSVVQLYSLWRERKDEIERSYQILEEKNIVKREAANVWKHIKWRHMQRKRGRQK